jgi:ubiquinone/menaquinone biosynthesis C-methylase UbiE
MLDIGCGPVGSLEWADRARVRVGLDPLVDSYRALGIADHAMRYVAAQAECMPFADGSFDIVSSFNSLDHVDDLDETIAEITRLLAPGGRFLLLVEVNHPPTLTEPITLGWDVVDRFGGAFEQVLVRHLDTAQLRLYDAALGRVLLADPRSTEPAGLLALLRKAG